MSTPNFHLMACAHFLHEDITEEQLNDHTFLLSERAWGPLDHFSEQALFDVIDTLARDFERVFELGVIAGQT